MLKRNELISYSMEFASFLISRVENIDKIILHGSVVKDEFDEDSDVDLFIDASEKSENKIKKTLEEFYKTEDYKKWKLKGLENDFSLMTGRIESKEWGDLKRAMITNSIILYGRFTFDIEKSKGYVLLSFENI